MPCTRRQTPASHHFRRRCKTSATRPATRAPQVLIGEIGAIRAFGTFRRNFVGVDRAKGDGIGEIRRRSGPINPARRPLCPGP